MHFDERTLIWNQCNMHDSSIHTMHFATVRRLRKSVPFWVFAI